MNKNKISKVHHLHSLDQGEMNTAENILQKDVSEAYKTANDILKAEEAIDNNKATITPSKRNKEKSRK